MQTRVFLNASTNVLELKPARLTKVKSTASNEFVINLQSNYIKDNQSLFHNQTNYAQCRYKDEYQAGKDSMSWFCNHSESSERGDTCTKSNEKDSFCNGLDSSSSIGCAVTTKVLIIREEAEIDRFLQNI